MAFVNGVRQKPRRRFSKSRAEALSDAFSSLYAGAPRVVVNEPLVARLVAKEIDRQKKKVMGVLSEWKRLDPKNYQKRLSALSRERGLDRAFFELRKEISLELHLPLALVDYSRNGASLEAVPSMVPGDSVARDEFLATQREPGSKALGKMLSPELAFPPAARTKLSRNEAWSQILRSFELEPADAPAMRKKKDSKP